MAAHHHGADGISGSVINKCSELFFHLHEKMCEYVFKGKVCILQDAI